MVATSHVVDKHLYLCVVICSAIELLGNLIIYNQGQIWEFHNQLHVGTLYNNIKCFFRCCWSETKQQHYVHVVTNIPW